MKPIKLFVFGLSFFLIISCSKEKEEEMTPEIITEAIDERDSFVGKYEGIEIYTDNQQSTVDTSLVILYLNKYGVDSLLELDLPPTTNMYYYSLSNGVIQYYGNCYHCPSLVITNDSLYSKWTPSLAPRFYEFIMKKSE